MHLDRSLSFERPGFDAAAVASRADDLARARAVLEGADARLLRAIAEVASRLLEGPAPLGEDAPTLVFDAVQNRVTLGERGLTLPVRSPLRRILEGLVEAGPEPQDVSRLFALGWPGERVVARAARNRVHVALATLRRGLLGDHLERGRRGYALATGVLVVRTPTV